MTGRMLFFLSKISENFYILQRESDSHKTEGSLVNLEKVWLANSGHLCFTQWGLKL